MNETCKLCGKALSEADKAAYGSRCEDCWCCPPARTPLYGAAIEYSGEPLGQMEEISNQGPFLKRWTREKA